MRVPRPQAVEWLLKQLCTRYGFCLPEPARAELIESPPTDSATFTAAIFRAEGMNPGEHPRLARAVQREMERLYASDLSSHP